VSAQAIYSRAFYAAGNTFLPMVAATAVTLLSLPVYAVLYRWQGAMGLAVASNLGIALQTVTLAVLLHSRRMVSLASIDYAEMGRCLLAGGAGGGAVWGVFTWGEKRWAVGSGLICPLTLTGPTSPSCWREPRCGCWSPSGCSRRVARRCQES